MKIALAALALAAAPVSAQMRVSLPGSMRPLPAASAAAVRPLSASASAATAAQSAPSAVSTAESLGALAAEPERLAPAVAEAVDGSASARAETASVDGAAAQLSAAPSLSPAQDRAPSVKAVLPQPIEHHASKALRAAASPGFVVKALAFIAAAFSAVIAYVVGVPGALMIIAGMLQSHPGLVGLGAMSVVAAAPFYLIARRLDRKYLRKSAPAEPAYHW